MAGLKEMTAALAVHTKAGGTWENFTGKDLFTPKGAATTPVTTPVTNVAPGTTAKSPAQIATADKAPVRTSGKPTVTTPPPMTMAMSTGLLQPETPVVPTFTPNAYVAPQRDPVNVISMEDSINGLLAGDSRYIKQARQAGMETGASRGLLNSSISAGAAERAAIEAALPIAQQDAGYTQDLGRTAAQEDASSRLSYQDYTQTGDLSNYAADTTASAFATKTAAEIAAAKALAETQAGQIKQQGDIDAILKDKEIIALAESAKKDQDYALELQQAGANQTLILSAQQIADKSKADLELAKVQAGYTTADLDKKIAADKDINTTNNTTEIYKIDTTAELTKWQEEMQQIGANFRAEQTNAANLAMKAMDLDADGRAQVSSIINDAADDLGAEIAKIMSDTNTDKPAKEKLIAAMYKLYKDRTDEAVEVYLVPIEIPNLDDIKNPTTPVDPEVTPDIKPDKDVTTHRSDIAAIYTKLGFPADDKEGGGFDYWTALLNDGTYTLETIEAAIKAAGEAINQDTKDYVDGLLNPGGVTVVPPEEEKDKDTRTPEEKMQDIFDRISNGK